MAKTTVGQIKRDLVNAKTNRDSWRSRGNDPLAVQRAQMWADEIDRLLEKLHRLVSSS